MPTRRHRVLLADDHAMVAEGLAAILRQEFELVGVVHDGAAAIEAARRLEPDVIVADISMPVVGGMAALRALKAEGNEARVVFVTMHNDAALAGEAMRAGASGYVLKHAAGEELVRAVHEAAAGRMYLTPLITRGVLAAMASPDPLVRLTSRQREVLALVTRGLTMKEVAAELGISPRTVETHKYEMMHALGLTTNAELVQYALRHGVLAAPGAPAAP